MKTRVWMVLFVLLLFFVCLFVFDVVDDIVECCCYPKIIRYHV